MANILILDGGLGTSLEQVYDQRFSHATPLWSSHLLVSDQDTLLACQRDFGAVPADVILTATYQVSAEGFSKTKTPAHPQGIGLSSIPRFLNDAVSISEKAKRDGAHVALSVGPYGACMIPSQEYTGAYDAAHSSEGTLETWHLERMKLFSGIADLRSRVSYIALETIPRVDEIVAMRKAIGSVAELAPIPFWTSCLFPGDTNTLPDGTSVSDAVAAMLDPHVAEPVPWGIGVNCTKTWKLEPLLKEYEGAVTRMLEDGSIENWPALVLYPDGTNGEVYNTVTQTWELPTGAKSSGSVPWEHQLASVVRRTQERANWSQIIVGGCCMASYKDVQRLRQSLLPSDP